MDNIILWTSAEVSENYNKFKQRRDSLVSKLKPIKLPTEVTTTQVKEILSQLDEINNEIFSAYAWWQSMEDNIDDLIDETRKMNTDGSNETLRVANGYKKCAQYKRPSDQAEVNLFEIRKAIREIAAFYDEVTKLVKHKSDRLITLASVLKTESSLG